MKTRRQTIETYALVIALIMSTAIVAEQGVIHVQSAVQPHARVVKAAVQQNYGQLPLSFIPNAGQTDEAVHFQVNSLGGTLFFTSQEVVLSLPQTTSTASDRSAEQKIALLTADSAQTMPDRSEPTTSEPPLVVKMQLIGANAEAEIMGADPLPGIVNYFIGNDPSQWHANIPTYAGITYRDVYPGIDLHYDGHQGNLKGTYTVAAGVDPSIIRWRYSGNTALSIDPNSGDLLISLSNGNVLREVAPTAWQEKLGQREAVETRYVLDGEEVRFVVADYESKLPLVIDPDFEYSTYLGGTLYDSGDTIAVDNAGNAYVTGSTGSTNFPTANPWQGTDGNDIFVTKLSATGSSLVFSTYLGGSAGDWGSGITVDSIGDAYVTGATASTNFPTTNAFQANKGGGISDAFVTKLSSSGANLIYSTYLGGSSEDSATEIELDEANNAYVAGYTNSTDFPITNAFQVSYRGGTYDGFVTKLMPLGNSLGYSTYLGGSGADNATNIVVDNSGSAYVTGRTTSINFPITSAFQSSYGGGTYDGFVTRLGPLGNSIVYSTYLGGSAEDSVMSIVVDVTGAAYVTGWTASTNFPTSNAFQGSYSGIANDGFVTKLGPLGNSIVYSTYLGGNSDDLAINITVDDSGSAYIVGWTYSTNFPIVNAIQQSNAGGSDGFITKLTPAGNNLVYSTYFGGSGSEAIRSVAMDNNENIYITGSVFSADFPTRNPFQSTYGGEGDAFVVKIIDGSVPTPTGTLSATPTHTITATSMPSATATLTATSTATSTFTATPSVTPSVTSSPTATETASPTPTHTPTVSSTPTFTPTSTSTVIAPHPDTIGIFRPSQATFYLRNSNTTGYADSVLTFGASTYYPITGDWDGDGIDTPGVYQSSIGQFYLTNSTANPAALHYTFTLGIAGDQPIVGDWDGDGKDGVGVFRPSNGLIYLKNNLTTGFADFTMVLGIPGDVGLAGDWNGDGKDSPGVYRPSNQVFYLTNSICNCAVFADAQLGLGITGDKPFVGDWDGDGKDGVGVYRQSNGLTYIKNALTTGFADSSFVYGSANDFPLAGYWVRVSTPSAVEPAPTFQPSR